MNSIETILKKGGDGSLYLEDRRTIVIQLTEFNNTNKYPPAAGSRSIKIFLENDESLNAINYIYAVAVYPKGRSSSNKDLVFLKFKFGYTKPLYCSIHESINCRAEWTYLVSIVDSEGYLKYTQSFTWIFDGTEKPADDTEWIQVVSADSLQRDADVLLPDDTLTIHVDMVLKQYYPGKRCTHSIQREILQSSFGEKEQIYELKMLYDQSVCSPLRLDSPLGEILRKESRYFERLCATSMVEKNSGYVKISEDEKITFRMMVGILNYPHMKYEGRSTMVTFKEILDIYALADFYGIERVLDTCRCWLRLISRNHFSCLSREDVTAISKLLETYDDPILREIVGTLTRNEGETQMDSGVEHEPWTCELVVNSLVEQLYSFEQPAKMKKKEHVTEDVSALSHCYI